MQKKRKDNVMVVLPLFNSDGSENMEFYQKLAEHFDADLAFICPPHKCERENGKKAWYKVTPAPERKNIFDDGQFKSSVELIEDKLGLFWMKYDKVILVGHGQGALMAMYSILFEVEVEADLVIALCPFWPKELPFDAGKAFYKSRIVWVEGVNDEVLTDELKDSYEQIAASIREFHYLKGYETTHRELSPEIIEELKEKGICL